MSKTDQIINELLKHNESISLKDLSVELNLPVRTCQRYIKNIKDEYPNLIEFTHNKYRLNKKWFDQYNNNKEEQQSRSKRIIQLLINHEEGISYDELLDNLYISDSTLNKDIFTIKTILRRYNLNITFKEGIYTVSGDEKGKRNLIKDYIYGEIYKSLTTIDTLEEFFPTYNVKKIETVIKNIFDKYNIFINDYNLYSLILHIVIKTERTSNGFIQDKNCFISDNIKNIDYFIISKEICEKVGEIENISFDDNEIYEYSRLIATFTHSGINEKEFSDITYSFINNKVDFIIQTIKEVYKIDFSNVDFINNFSLHLGNLYIRQKTNIINRNPLLSEIKSNYPFIYDMALYVTNNCLKDFGTISDDETAYIALYFISSLEYIKHTDNKLKCVLINSNVCSLNKQIVDYLHKSFGNRIYIVNAFNSFDQLNVGNTKYDVIFTTNKHHIDNDNILYIDPFPNDANIQKIGDKINIIYNKSTINNLINNTLYLTDKNNFIVYNEIINAEIAIKNATDYLTKENYISDDYYICCIEREHLSPTAHKDIALPHPVNPCANKSAIHISVNKKYFKWIDGSKTKIIFLLAVNPNEINKFRSFFDLIAKYLNSDSSFNNTSRINNYDDFIQFLNQIY